MTRPGRFPQRHESGRFGWCWSASKHDPDLSPFYQRVVAAGKPKKVALTATIRQLIVMSNAVEARGTQWQPERP